MDVFISYEHQSKPIADNICAVLESKGVRCWYAPRDVYGDYATSIVEAIENCKVFVLILNCSSSNSPHVLNEVEIAYKRILKGELVIVPFKVDEGLLSKAMEYYVKRLHWIDAVSAPQEQAIIQLYEQLVPILGLEQKDDLGDTDISNTNLVRKNNKYYSADDLVEIKRLGLEDELLFEYEKPYYDKLLKGRKNLVALDFSTLNPRSSLKRLNRAEFDKVICMAYDQNVVNEGNDMCANVDRINFFRFDTETDDLDIVLPEVMKKCGVDKLDFVNFQMAFMDLKNPFRVLRKIKKYLAPDGLAYVRDVDDGVVFAFPDENRYFAEIKEFYKLDPLSGSRNSARQVYNTMKKLGAKEINLERCGLSTASMEYDEKRLLFKSWFSFIPNDFKQLLKKEPQNEKYKKIVKWIDENFDELEEEFFSEDFLFNSGYIFYTVKF